MNKAVRSYPQLNEVVPLGPNVNEDIRYCYATRVDLICWNLAKVFQFMETFLTSPKFE